MADRLKQKRPREEVEQESPSEALTSLRDNENQHQQEEDSSVPTTQCIHPLRLREMGKNVKLPHIYRDYHVHVFCSANQLGSISFIVPGNDMILVVYSHKKIVLFRRHGDQISAAEDGHGRAIVCGVEGSINSVCYNNHDNSFLIEYFPFGSLDQVKIISLQVGRGLSPTCRRVFPGEPNIVKWDFDIPMCRGMIHNCKDRKFKFCELKEYTQLFTIPDFGFRQVYAHHNPICDRRYFKFLSPGNMDMVMYEKVSSGLNGIHLRFYSKHNGVLQKEIFLPYPSHGLGIEFIALCGSHTVLVQRQDLQMEVVEMSCENPVSIINSRNTKIRAACDPYYLHKRSQFICYTESKAIHVCNLQGEILVTLADHLLENCAMVKTVSFFHDSYVPKSQDILISLCRHQSVPSRLRWMYSVTVSSIVTGECLAKFTSEDPNCSEIRKAAFTASVFAFAYDERTHEIFTGTNEGVCAIWSNKFHNDAVDVNLYEPEEEEEEESDLSDYK